MSTVCVKYCGELEITLDDGETDPNQFIEYKAEVEMDPDYSTTRGNFSSVVKVTILKANLFKKDVGATEAVELTSGQLEEIESFLENNSDHVWDCGEHDDVEDWRDHSGKGDRDYSEH